MWAINEMGKEVCAVWGSEGGVPSPARRSRLLQQWQGPLLSFPALTVDRTCKGSAAIL